MKVPPVVVIGYGNPLRSDDGVGRYVVQRLRELVAGHAKLIECHQLSVEQAELVAQAGFVVFVDAGANGTPGALQYQPVTPRTESEHGSHSVTPATLISVASELYGRAPNALLITIAGEEFELGESLSECVKEAADTVVGHIAELVSRAAKHGKGESAFAATV